MQALADGILRKPLEESFLVQLECSFREEDEEVCNIGWGFPRFIVSNITFMYLHFSSESALCTTGFEPRKWSTLHSDKALAFKTPSENATRLGRNAAMECRAEESIESVYVMRIFDIESGTVPTKTM